MLNAIECAEYEARLDAMDAYAHKADRKAEEFAEEVCDACGLEGQERDEYFAKVYHEEYERLVAEYEKTL